MATRRTILAVVAIGFAQAGLAAESAPLSAIDWLSNSIDVEDAPAVATSPPPAAPILDVTVLPLDTPVADSAGLMDATDLGLEPGLWGRSSAADLTRGLTELGNAPDAPPSLNRFVINLVTAKFDAPIDAAIDDTFFLARMDWLLKLGHLDLAEKLALQAGSSDPDTFRRLFDIALLMGQEAGTCETIEKTPELSPTYPARIFCLARLGQWDVAALTLGNAETLGILTPEEDALLLRFLDPDLFEDPLPPVPTRPSPLMFRLYEAVGERIPTDQLPVAFATADLSDIVGWKTRLRAAERLTATGAMSFDDLLKIYLERKPAASGGIWERVAALQSLASALEQGDAETVDRHLPNGWSAARQAGYAAGFAAWVAPRLAGLSLTGQARHLAFEIALLAEDAELAAAFANRSQEDQFLLALAQGARGANAGSDPLARAILRGLSAFGPGASFDALIQDDRQGEALFRALAQLSEGAAGNPDATARSLTLLRKLGLEALARQIAIELVLMEGAA